jgi:hypothetical protein
MGGGAMSETSIIFREKSLLDLALEKTELKNWDKTIAAECDLALAYLNGNVSAEAVASVMKIARVRVCSWWPQVLMKALRHGMLEVRLKGSVHPASENNTEGPHTSYSKR